MESPIPPPPDVTMTITHNAPAVDSVDAASIVPVIATPPDANSIPVEPPHGSPRPPVGQLLPDVAASEEASVPMVMNTPPPSTPSPVAQPAPVPADAYPSSTEIQQDPYVPPVSDASFPNPDAYPEPEHEEHEHRPDAPFEQPVFDDTPFKTETDGDIMMDGVDHPMNGNGIHSSPHLMYPNSPLSLSAHVYGQDDIDGPPPAKRQKLEPSVSPAPKTRDCQSHSLLAAPQRRTV